jgi:hypothetical protein
MARQTVGDGLHLAVILWPTIGRQPAHTLRIAQDMAHIAHIAAIHRAANQAGCF